ncbi:N-hydroxyarylamine O-acetyltransferase [Shigella sonnei]|nr:N-hydroxyarylamine O-acetyltransferase [Shigella sonnei]CSQ82285.1 N-hydroxyarylamine O-acetyltransferase [Shigella sonnei]
MTPILNHYFARINWSGAAAVNIDTLRALHLKHNCTIPFENLDVLLPREIQLDDQSLEEKLVIARRGGYCFEQNGVFERVLRELGFNVRSLLGRVVLSNPPALPPRTHRLLLVEPRQPDGCKLKTAPVRPVVAARSAEYVCSEDLFY